MNDIDAAQTRAFRDAASGLSASRLDRLVEHGVASMQWRPITHPPARAQGTYLVCDDLGVQGAGRFFGRWTVDRVWCWRDMPTPEADAAVLLALSRRQAQARALDDAARRTAEKLRHLQREHGVSLLGTALVRLASELDAACDAAARAGDQTPDTSVQTSPLSA